MYDVVIVGSGHNGLIAASYLAKAGCKVAVFERRPIVGGAVCTQTDLIPGYRIDVGSSAHVMIHQTPVLADLELHRFGLEYLEMDPWAWYPIPRTGESISFYRDISRTCESIARISPRDAVAYEKFCSAWGGMNEEVFNAFLRPPTPVNLALSFFKSALRGRLGPNRLRLLMSSYGRLVDETFEHEALRTAILWLAAQSGPPPSEPRSGDFAGWHAMYHRSGMKRARGGSGALTQALKKRLLADGAHVFENAPVAAIETDGHGRARGVRLENGERHEARAVIAACHIKTTLDKLLANAPDLPASIRARSAKMKLGNGFGMIIRCAMSGLPEYPGQRLDARGVGECHHGLQLLCPSRPALDAAYADWSAGHPPAYPVPLVMTFSALDDTLAPPGRHVMFVWGQYHAYELSNGEKWDDIREREADKLLDAVEAYAPGTKAKVLDRFIQTPLDIERLHDMHRGNVMHLEMTFDQMFTFRPMRALSSYRVPGLRGLYLTGASTHPGGGVWGASGHNTAHLMLHERALWSRP
jgi:phytoene dehydrogenase-like protein